MKWIGYVFIIVCVILTYFCITPVSAGSRSDLVFDLGGGVRDLLEGDSKDPGGVVHYSTKPAGETKSQLRVWVEGHDNSINANYVYNYERPTFMANSPCSLGDECSYLSEDIVLFQLGNYFVKIFISINDDTMSHADGMATAQKIAEDSD